MRILTLDETTTTRNNLTRHAGDHISGSPSHTSECSSSSTDQHNFLLSSRPD